MTSNSDPKHPEAIISNGPVLLTVTDGSVAAMRNQLAEVAGTEEVPPDDRSSNSAIECEYPLTPVPGEKYDYVLIFCDNESDYTNPADRAQNHP